MLALAWVLLPCAPERANDAEDRAVAVITKARGSITRDLRAKAKPVIGVNLTNVKDADAVMKELKEFKNLQKLNLTTTDVTDVGLKELRERQLYVPRDTDIPEAIIANADIELIAPDSRAAGTP